MDRLDNIKKSIENAPKIAVIGSPSDTFVVTIDILEESSKQKLLGELVFFETIEGDSIIISIGQITAIRTINKWHEEPSFKAVIKRHGYLPHLSDVADNRLAELTIQSSFRVAQQKIETHKLSNSPSTGVFVRRVTNDLMKNLLQDIIEDFKIEYLGCAYGTDVKIPFWFKHFGKEDGGVGEAYHIGVFGRTGSGKTTTAAQILKGYANNYKHMSILILDPQEQFYLDQELLPNERSFRKEVEAKGITYHKIRVPEDVYLPNNPELFAELLNTSGFIRKTFRITTENKRELMAESVAEYIETRIEKGGFQLSKANSERLLRDMLERFKRRDDNDQPSKYIRNVYTVKNSIERLEANINEALETTSFKTVNKNFKQVLRLFQGENSMDDMVKEAVSQSGHMFVVNLAPRSSHALQSDNVQALLIKLITEKAIEIGEELWGNNEHANCLIVMDEAHRYVNSSTSDPRIKELNRSIVDAVRTTRKYGIGYMFITQTIASLDPEIIRMMRIFSFGYGLTMGNEFSTIKQIINDENAASFYRSFIDPASNKKYPFMFHGPISPLSFSGFPLFIEMKP